MSLASKLHSKVSETAPLHHDTHSPKSDQWWKTSRTKWTGWISFGVAVVGLLLWWFVFHPYVTTDDARVAATLVRVAPEAIGGRVIRMAVTEGDHVKKGDVLVELDHRIAEAELQRAKARAVLTDHELRRISELVAQRGLAPKDLDTAKANAETSQAELKLAEVADENTTIRSPVDGIVIQKVTEEGNIVEPGQTVVTVSDVDHAWIAANIEETSVGAVKVGQPVHIVVDEGGTLTGKVSEVRASVASQFALIPSDTGAGNFTKVVQRVPIKVSIDGDTPHVLRAGQSVEIKIRVH
jgi:RND family efflux transporter MFP subunit